MKQTAAQISRGKRSCLLASIRTALFLATLFALAGPVAGRVDVTQFGAVPDDGKDDTAAFLAAFRSSSDRGDGNIFIPKGIYHLRADGNTNDPGTLLSIARKKEVVIEGNGAELILRGTASVFGFYECTNVIVRGFLIDWERPPFSEGTVIASEPRSADVQIAAGYPVQGGERVGAFMSYDPATRLPAGKNMDVYDSVDHTELVRPQVLRMHFTRDIPIPVGTLLVLRHQVYGNNAINFNRCADVQVSDVTVYTTPGMGLVAVHSTDVSLNRFNVLLRPGSKRLMSATADATHFGGCKGTVTLEDCVFEGMGDDGANIKSGLYLIVRKRLDDRTVLGQHNLKMVDMPDAGDVMEMSHTDALIPFASGKLRAATMEPGEGNFHRVVFEEPLPADLLEGDVLGNASRTPKLLMRHCTVRANRARGVLCQTRNAIIEDCTFQNCTSAGVLVLTEVVHFHESIGTSNVIVRNNRFENCNRGAASAEAPLAALAWLKNFAYPPKPGVHKDIIFENNQIKGAEGCGIFAVAVDGITIRNNQIEFLNKTGQNTAIRVLNCSRVVQENNSPEK